MYQLFIAACPYVSLNNGYVSHDTADLFLRYRPGTNVTYTCYSGYYRSSGWRRRTCKSNGQWDGYQAVCSPGNKKSATLMLN